jgi:hypothetical protein
MRPFQCCGRLLLGLLCGPVATALNVINIAGINGDGSLVRVGGGFVAVEWEDAMGSVSMFLVGSGLGADVDSIWQNQGTYHNPTSRSTELVLTVTQKAMLYHRISGIRRSL